MAFDRIPSTISPQSLRSVKILRPAGEQLVRRELDGVVLLLFDEDLRQQFRTAAVTESSLGKKATAR